MIPIRRKAQRGKITADLYQLPPNVWVGIATVDPSDKDQLFPDIHATLQMPTREIAIAAATMAMRDKGWTVDMEAVNRKEGKA